METDTIVTLSVIGGLLLLNIISWILAWTTSYGKSWIYYQLRTATKGYFIFWNFWMFLVGITFWFAAIFSWIRYGYGVYSEFDDKSPKDVYQMLEDYWSKGK